MLPPATTPIHKESLPVMNPVIHSKTSTPNPAADRDKKNLNDKVSKGILVIF